MKSSRLFFFFIALSFVACRQNTSVPPSTDTALLEKPMSPDEQYGKLFKAVQLAHVFKDSKTFTDCTPKAPTAAILAAFEEESQNANFNIKAFVDQYFEHPQAYASGFKSDTSRTAEAHINVLWDVLTRQADSIGAGTLLPLPKPYIVPGGRFGEIYYWDSYFTMLGLEAAGKWEMIQHMADNFAYLINTYGYIPNGNRTYFLGRSQPPFYSLIVRLLANQEGEEALLRYAAPLEKEYAFWMDGYEEMTAERSEYRRLVRLEDGSILNRYWDDRPVPRPESYREDVELAKSVERPAVEIYRDLRAACESGWDFSSRWFEDGQYLSSIHTSEIIPVDLNALLSHLEAILQQLNELKGNTEKAAFYQQRFEQRKEAMMRYNWDAEQGFFVDYDFVKREPTPVPSIAGMFPLFFELADTSQARLAADKLEKVFLKPGGVVSTINTTGQQWDAPNGWAPLQWISIKGLRNYGYTALADSIKTSWVNLNLKVYRQTGKMVEKYNVMDMSLEAGGGEYPVQDGFGWTNGVLLRLLTEDATLND
ncbi:MAG: alpha,alpha-trehalase TreF [Bacteroidota bacterium]